MKELPLVSICIPTYNAAEFLAPCLQSALAQTYPQVEILVCDDGSTDETVNIVKRLQQQHPHLRLVQNSQNLGMVANWNACIEQAEGEWIKFLFQDDLLEPACVEEMLTACQRHNVEVGLCRRDFIVHDNVPAHIKRDFSAGGIPKAEEVFSPAPFISSSKLASAVAIHPLTNFLGEPTCFFFHKDLLTKTTAFHPDLKQLVDYEFIVRLGLERGLAFVPHTLAHFRVHGASESMANAKVEKAAQLRTIAATTGDYLLLFQLYLHHPGFALVKEAVGAKTLDIYLKHLYYSACKHKGERVVNEALQTLRQKYPDLCLRYSFFKYAYYRRLFKRWEKGIKSNPPSGSIDA